MENSFRGKYFSILGDSVSTLEGYQPSGYGVYYRDGVRFSAGVFFYGDTWWGQTIDRLGGKLLANDSWSGSLVCRHPDCMIPSYGASDERCAALGRGGILPDVILVFMGINDWGWGMRVRAEREADLQDLSVFETAYAAMLAKLKANYPKADIRCMVMGEHAFEREGRLPQGMYPLEEYREVIRTCAKKAGAAVIELLGMAYCEEDTLDGLHPNARGMRAIADTVCAQMEKA